MSDNDLIRRGDALEAVAGWEIPSTAIAALPAVTVGVPEATVYRAVLDWIRDDAGAAVKMSMTPDRANALTARILAALEPQPAPDALDELARLGQEWDADDVETCGKCMGSGYGGHPDSGALCTDCHGKGGIIRKPAPDAAAIREAWGKAYWRMRSYAIHDNDCKLNKPPHFNGPCSCGLTAALEEALALITKGGDGRRVYMGQIMAECDCPREAECQAAGRCIAEGRR